MNILTCLRMFSPLQLHNMQHPYSHLSPDFLIWQTLSFRKFIFPRLTQCSYKQRKLVTLQWVWSNISCFPLNMYATLRSRVLDLRIRHHARMMRVSNVCVLCVLLERCYHALSPVFIGCVIYSAYYTPTHSAIAYSYENCPKLTASLFSQQHGITSETMRLEAKETALIQHCLKQLG